LLKVGISVWLPATPIKKQRRVTPRILFQKEESITKQTHQQRGSLMKRILLAATALAAIALSGMVSAKADIVLTDLVFRDLGATGFGNAPRLLTLQNSPLESGGTIATAGGGTSFFFGDAGTTVPQTACTSNGTCGAAGGGTRTGTNESLVYSVGALGWTSGAQVGIGLDTNQTGNSGPLSFTGLTLTLYNSAGAVLGSFSGNSPVDISQALLTAQQGNGNSVFDLALDATQQAQYDAIINNPLNGGINNIFEGLRASFGCGSQGPAVCGTTGNFSSNDGAESFLAFQQSPVPGPIAGAGIPGLVGLGLLWLARRRQLRNGNLTAA
jgi:hypothetical protein